MLSGQKYAAAVCFAGIDSYTCAIIRNGTSAFSCIIQVLQIRPGFDDIRYLHLANT